MTRDRVPSGRAGGQVGSEAAYPVPAQMQARLGRLTPRQKDCLRLAKPGYPSKAIARDLDISPLRVDAHIGDAMMTLGIGSRFEAARFLRLWELQEQVGTLGVQMGAQPAPLPDATDLLSDRGVDDAEAVTLAPPMQATPAGPGEESVFADPDTRALPPLRFLRSARHVRIAPSFFAAVVSIIAIAIAVGAVTALLIAFDWNGHG